MSRVKYVIVIFYDDGTHDRYEQTHGFHLPDIKNTNIKSVYVATSNSDADAAISMWG